MVLAMCLSNVPSAPSARDVKKAIIFLAESLGLFSKSYLSQKDHKALVH